MNIVYPDEETPYRIMECSTNKFIGFERTIGMKRVKTFFKSQSNAKVSFYQHMKIKFDEQDEYIIVDSRLYK
jgi:hypothetical protein